MSYALLGLILVLALQFTVFFGPPYVPTRRAQRLTALRLLGLKPGQTVYDLGCGDGRFLKEAAARGLQAVGYEINPFLVLVARWHTRACRAQVKIVWGNFWQADLAAADGVYVFLASKFMKRLDELLKSSNRSRPLKVVSYGFKIPGRRAATTQDGLILYYYK